MKNRPLGGRSLETYSHPIDMINQSIHLQMEGQRPGFLDPLLELVSSQFTTEADV